MKRSSYRWVMVVTLSCVFCAGVSTVSAQDGADPFASDINIGGGQDRDEFASEEVSGSAKTSSRKKERISRKDSEEKREEKPSEKKEEALEGSLDEEESKVEKKRAGKKADVRVPSQRSNTVLNNEGMDESDF